MKNQTTRNRFSFILLLCGIFSISYAQAQNCPSNKVWACRYDSCGIQECKCINANQVATWTSTVPKCSWNWHPNCCNGWRNNQDESGMEIKTSLRVYPNPVTTSATVSFFLEHTQNVSLGIYDMSGRLISTLADKIFEEGVIELAWTAENVNRGVYFLQFQSEEHLQMIKWSVTK